MFLPVNHSKFATPMPRDCSFRESDWRALAGFWPIRWPRRSSANAKSSI